MGLDSGHAEGAGAVTWEMHVHVGLEFSWRYGVMGVYKDRERPIVRVYPLPFIRLTIELEKTITLEQGEEA